MMGQARNAWNLYNYFHGTQLYILFILFMLYQALAYINFNKFYILSTSLYHNKNTEVLKFF